MSNTSSESENKALFWGCFVALIATAFGFVGRMFLIPTWAQEFGLDPQQAGRLAGIGIWPFAVGIILFSLIIDSIGYKKAMYFAFFSHVTYGIMAFAAAGVSDKKTAYSLLYYGSFILGLGNGTIEAFINPVVATMYSREKVKWLNILHAAWPGGLVLAGILTIALGDIAWKWKVGMIIIPAIVYFIMLVGIKFPVSERVQGGVSYKEMLQEFGVFGALLVSPLIAMEVGAFFGLSGTIQFVIAAVLIAAFGFYSMRLGRPLLFVLMVIMIPLAVTEIGTDGWITGVMEDVMKENSIHPGWVLVYTSAIMLVLRFFAGPIAHACSPLGLLAISCVLAIGGLTFLSMAQGLVMITIAATLYGFGKTFFWPTMLGVVSEQCPKGGALTLNAISGLGMLAVGVLGFPFIGKLQVEYENKALLAKTELHQQLPGLVKDGKIGVLTDKTSIVGNYQGIDDAALAKITATAPPEAVKTLAEVRGHSKQKALMGMTIFPIFMLICYLGLMLYFRGKGGYKQIHLDSSK